MVAIHELKVDIANNKIGPLYVFIGEEIGIMNIYINQIANTLNTIPNRVDSLKEISSTLSAKGFLKSRNLYVIRDDKHYQKQETIWNSFLNGELQGDSVVVLLYTKMDKRSKFYKRHESVMTEFEKLPEEVLAKYVEKEIGLTQALAIQLCRNCGNDYTRIMLECDKLQNLDIAKNFNNIGKTYIYAIENQLIDISMGDVIFDFINAVVSRNHSRAYKLKLYLDEQNVMGALTLFYRNFKSILIVKTGEENKSNLGSYQIYHAKKFLTNYSIKELLKILAKIREIEKGIKTGLISQEIALDYLLVNVL